MNYIRNKIDQHPLRVILVITLITALAIGFCFTLRLETDIKRMLPEGTESVSAFNDIDQRFGGGRSALCCD